MVFTNRKEHENAKFIALLSVKLSLFRCMSYFRSNKPKSEDDKYAYDIIQKAYWINEKKTEMLDFDKSKKLLQDYFKVQKQMKGDEKMKNFVGFTSNGEYSVGCTGQTVYLYDKDGKELAKFKDLIYAYSPMISPDGKIFVVKSTEGRLAVYSLESVALIKKFRFSKVNGAQDDNFCFSPNGREFYNIERHIDSCKTALSVYDTSDFSLTKRILSDDYSLVLTAIEYNFEEERIFLLGYMRDHQSGVAYKFFVGELMNDSLQNLVYISENEHNFYLDCKHYEIHSCGITDCYTHDEIEKIKNAKHLLAKLWKYYSK